jgi:hypothetical protein
MVKFHPGRSEASRIDAWRQHRAHDRRGSMRASIEIMLVMHRLEPRPVRAGTERSDSSLELRRKRIEAGSVDPASKDDAKRKGMGRF